MCHFSLFFYFIVSVDFSFYFVAAAAAIFFNLLASIILAVAAIWASVLGFFGLSSFAALDADLSALVCSFAALAFALACIFAALACSFSCFRAATVRVRCCGNIYFSVCY